MMLLMLLFMSVSSVHIGALVVSFLWKESWEHTVYIYIYIPFLVPPTSQGNKAAAKAIPMKGITPEPAAVSQKVGKAEGETYYFPKLMLAKRAGGLSCFWLMASPPPQDGPRTRSAGLRSFLYYNHNSLHYNPTVAFFVLLQDMKMSVNKIGKFWFFIIMMRYDGFQNKRQTLEQFSVTSFNPKVPNTSLWP